MKKNWIFNMTEYTEKVHKWLRDCKPGTYPLVELTREPAKFIEAVKQFIDTTKFHDVGYVINFDNDYTQVRKFEIERYVEKSRSRNMEDLIFEKQTT